MPGAQFRSNGRSPDLPFPAVSTPRRVRPRVRPLRLTSIVLLVSACGTAPERADALNQDRPPGRDAGTDRSASGSGSDTSSGSNDGGASGNVDGGVSTPPLDPNTGGTLGSTDGAAGGGPSGSVAGSSSMGGDAGSGDAPEGGDASVSGDPSECGASTCGSGLPTSSHNSATRWSVSGQARCHVDNRSSSSTTAPPWACC